MKKTITINISGIVFHIDVDAYEKLKSYLNKINSHFSIEEGGHEIISDIESRIAELFSEKSKNDRGVINENMVNDIIEIMGLPEDFYDTTNEENPSDPESKSAQSEYYQGRRKLYRDPESRVIGGVCSGLGHYLNLDKVLIRVLFVIILLVTSGIALPVYLILWIAVPKARTTSQRLEMKGDPITVENIGKSVKEELNEMKDGFHKNKKSREYKKKNYAEYSTDVTEKGLTTILLKILGISFIVIGFILLATLVFGIFASTRIIGILPGFESGFFLNHVFSSSLTSTLMFSSLIIVGMPILLIIYAGTKMLFNFVPNSRPVFLTALGVWIIGIIMAISTCVGAVDVFSTDASTTNNELLAGTSDTIYIKLDEREYVKYNDSQIEVNNFKVVVFDNDELLVARPQLSITRNNDNNCALTIKKYSRGNNYRTAKNNSENMNYGYTFDGSTLCFDPYFIITNNGKWRNQKVNVNLKLPDEKVVFIDDSLLPIINDIENTSHTWEGDMAGLYWQMKAEGLTQCK